MIEVVIPMLGVTVEQGTVVQWLKKEGDPVEKGEILFIVETEKVTTEVESPGSGILGPVLVPEGQEVPILTVASHILEPGESSASIPGPQNAAAPELARPVTTLGTAAGAAPSGTVPAVPAARKLARDNGIELAGIAPTGPRGEIRYQDVVAALEQPATGAVKSSSLARGLAAESGVDLASVQGTGVRGRVMRGDVAAAQTSRARPARIREARTVPMTSMRKTIAKHMCASKFSAPHISFFTDIILDPLLAFRTQILAPFEEAAGLRVSVNDLLIKASALCLAEFPEINASCDENNIYYPGRINVGLAVALPNGLVVPAVEDADSKGLAAVVRERSELVARARDGKLTMEELSRGTFTISSLAQSHVRQFTAILNPPQSGILSVPAARDELYLDNGAVKRRTVATYGLTVDHRIVDGSMAADFLASLKAKLELPAFTFLDI